MGKGWVVGALLLLGWVGASAYFIVSGAPINLPPEVLAYMPHFVVLLGAGLVFFRFRKLTGNTELDQANLYAVGSGIFLLILVALALITWGTDPTQGRNWLLAAITWAPIAVIFVVRYRSKLNTR